MQSMQGTADILVVDDEPHWRHDLIESLLFADIKATCVMAGNGLEAQQVLEVEKGIKVVVTDLAMPAMDGLALTEWIKANTPPPQHHDHLAKRDTWPSGSPCGNNIWSGHRARQSRQQTAGRRDPQDPQPSTMNPGILAGLGPRRECYTFPCETTRGSFFSIELN